MKIVLVEVRNQREAGERAFAQPTVKIGRDPACEVVFKQSDWPMVSRRHAEFRSQNGQWLIVDAGSTFGTYLDGQRIGTPTEVRPGAHVQFGAGGPVLRVARIEQDVAAADAGTTPRVVHTTPPQQQPRATPVSPSPSGQPPYPPPQQPPQQQYAQPQYQQQPSSQQQPPSQQQQQPYSAAPAPPPQPPSAPSAPASIEFSNKNSGKLERVNVGREMMLLGREPSSGVPIDASAAAVSRRHAEIRFEGGQHILVDLGSFNGTLLNGQRITAPSLLYDSDQIQLGLNGPVLRFIDAAHPSPPGRQAQGASGAFAGSALSWNSGAGAEQTPAPEAQNLQRTMVVKQGGSATSNLQPPTRPSRSSSDGQPQLLMQRSFDGKNELTIGRAPDNDIRLDGLQISNHHARLIKNQNGGISIEDAGSTNGVFLNTARVSGRRPFELQDVAQIGPFIIRIHPQRGVAIFDTRSKTRIDAIDITKVVANRSGGGQLKLLDDVDLTIQPNEFVGLLGPSGAGKSTLMDALNGMRPPTSGRVFINNRDFYQNLDALKQSIGYVPQDDIIHRELTVYRTLYYVARLRLSRDASKEEIDQIINEVLDVTGLSERRDVPVSQLSGGQRKRVSIAVELITKPSIIFLDEPTSGLDPATEEKIMKLFRHIAESGRTVILTTHAMENVRLFDKIVVMMRGKLVFYGKPQEALEFVKGDSFKDLYDKLEAPIEAEIGRLSVPAPNASAAEKRAFKQQREQISERVAEEWRRQFQQTEAYRQNVSQPLTSQRPEAQAGAVARRRTSAIDSIRQWGTLTRRYMQVLGRDRFNLLILFGQAPIVAFLTYLVVSSDAPRDFPFFMLALIAIWFGTSVAAREIVKEQAIYKRERMVNLGLLPYVSSKRFVLTMIVGAQCLMLFGTLKLFDLAGLMSLPSSPVWLFGIPQLIVMILTAMVGIALGLLVSAVVKTSEMATSLVPLILIPQILFSGLVGVPHGVSRLVGVAMPATWSFDEMKRLSGLDTLRPEGSDESGEHRGRGLYNDVRDRNNELIDDARNRITSYRQDAVSDLEDYERRMRSNLGAGRQPPDMPELAPAPAIRDPARIPEDLHEYVDFLHPWGTVVTNPLILLIMFFGLVIATLLVLRLQDIR